MTGDARAIQGKRKAVTDGQRVTRGDGSLYEVDRTAEFCPGAAPGLRGSSELANASRPCCRRLTRPVRCSRTNAKRCRRG
ncbi:hypothetical protein BLAT2472_20561 [Burkholderia latens]